MMQLGYLPWDESGWKGGGREDGCLKGVAWLLFG